MRVIYFTKYLTTTPDSAIVLMWLREERKIIMEIKHYRLHQGLDQDILYTYIKVGKRDFYLKRETWSNLKTFSIILLTTAAVFAIV